MQLIGMLDSPYVRRVAISLKCLDIPFEHHAISVFGGFERFQAINPVVKAPTLVCDDGEVLMDSGLILDYLDALAGPTATLMPASLGDKVQALKVIGLALAACEKTVQIVYEQKLRPADKQHGPWLERVRGQLDAAYGALEQALARRPLATDGTLDQAGITVAVAWDFSKLVLAEQLEISSYPRLEAYSRYAESLPVFIGTPTT